jgi:membrane-bound lytic murein transglycosylase D
MSRAPLPGLLALFAALATSGFAPGASAAATSPTTPTTAKPAPKKSAAKPARPQSARNRASDAATRHLVAAGPTIDDLATGADSPELKSLREAERELFPTATPSLGDSWPTELPSPLSATEDAPRVHASGLPPTPTASTPPTAIGGHDLAWLSSLTMPDLPVRWDARVVRYLEFFKDDPRGRQVLQTWMRRSGRYRDVVRRTLRKKGLPEDLLWLAMIESGFDPVVRSSAGAMGLWQFMPDTARAYGLSLDRWSDQRLNPEAATEAAADFLSDLHRRFGSWELAIAAYNMGYWGVAGSIRKYNTNDFWAMSRLECALPWETTLYVPKILAAAIVGRNPHVFGLDDVVVDAPLDGEPVQVPPATSLASIAQAAGCTTKEIEQLNPELRASRTPPAQPSSGGAPSAPLSCTVKVPTGRAALVAVALAKQHKDQPLPDRYVVRFGESLEQIAAAHGTTLAKLVALNAIGAGEVVRGGTVLLVPTPTTSTSAPAPSNVNSTLAAMAASPSAPMTKDDKQAIAVVPADIFVYPDRRRVFYRVLVGDTLREIAVTFHVTIDEVRRWNDLDPVASLQEGMTIQLFVPTDADLKSTVVLGENDVRVLPVGSDEFFAYWESLKGRKRITVTASAGDTLTQLGNRYGMTPGMMERINHRNRGERLAAGDAVVVYVAEARVGNGSGPVVDPTAPQPNGPLPDAPSPDALPPLR